VPCARPLKEGKTGIVSAVPYYWTLEVESSMLEVYLFIHSKSTSNIKHRMERKLEILSSKL